LFSYLLLRSGAFSGPVWVAIGTGLAIAISIALLLLRGWRPFDRLALVLTAAVMGLGVILNPSIDYLGTVFFVIGGIILVGQPEVPIRLGVGVTAVFGAGLLVRALLSNPEWTVLLSNLLGVVAVILFGANRRQRVLRLREAARASALEERTRIASDLHDLLAHSLGGLVVQLDAAGAELEQGHTADAVKRIQTSRQLAVDGLREARYAVEQLRSGAEAVGSSGPVDLVGAVRTVLRGPVGVQLGAELEVVGDPRPVGPHICEALVATAREALTNVNKHSPGARVSAALVFAPTRVRLEIVSGLAESEADGSAYDLATTGGGAGLPGLRERLTAVGGRLDTGPEGRRWVVAAECPVRSEPTARSHQDGRR
jgi:signal transduction histidine kinase